MKHRILAAVLMCGVMMGCHAASTTVPATAVAPGYLSPADQTLGESLAAVDAFVNQEKVNYQSLTAAQQAKEKAPLNALIAAVNVANTAYTMYHAGQETLAEAQGALTKAQGAQAALVAAKGVK